MNTMHLTTAPVISPIATDLAINELNAELGRLQAEAIRINDFVRKTRREKYQLIANTYFWWTDAIEQTNYLSDCYAAANIIVENKQVKTDFRSIMKLISQNQMPEKDLAEWVSCLEFIHHAVKNSPEVFATDRVNDIAHYIEVNGGISGIAQAKGTNKAKSSPQNNPANDGFFTLDEEEFHPYLIDEAKTLHTQQTHLPVINAPGLPLNGEGYGVAVVKKNGNGLVFVGAVNDPTYIQDAMFRTYRSDFEALPVTVRAVLEPLHILNEPQVVFRQRGKFIEKSKVVDPWNVEENLPAAKRLIFRGDHGHFLLSSVGIEASPVVISMPIQPVITGASSDLYLPFNIREEIETKLLDSKSFNLFETSDATQFTPNAGIFGTSYSVTLLTKLKIDDNAGIVASMLKRHTLNLHHSPLTFKPFLEFLGGLQQVEPHPQYFSPGWTCNADMAFINQLNHAFFFGWIEDLGKYAARDKHKTLSLLLDDKCWVIKYEKGNNGYDQAEVIALPAGMANGLATLEVRSTDLAFVFRQILDLKVIGKINIAANSDAIRIQFKTSANAFDCWIPAVDSAGARRATHFAPYVPVKTAKPMPQAAVPCDPDAIDPAYGLDGDDPELDEIIQSIQR